MFCGVLNLTDKETCEAWDRYALSHGSVAANLTTDYIKAITEGLGHTNLSLCCRNKSGDIIGIFPLVLTKSRLFGTFATSLPFFNYGGIIADNDQIKISLLSKGKEYARTHGASSLQLRESERVAAYGTQKGVVLSSHKAHMRYSLPAIGSPLGAGNAKQRAKLKSQSTLALRRTLESGGCIETKFGHLELLNDYYSVFSKHMRDLGTPVYSKSWFKAVLKTFGDTATISVTYVNGKPGAVGFLLKHNRYMNIPWASTLRKYNGISLNTHHYWQMLTYAQENDVEIFDFGRSTIDEGTYRFKQQWGAEAFTCYWYNIPLNEKNKIDNISPTNPKFSLAIRVWQKLPLFLTNMVGPYIVRSIP